MTSGVRIATGCPLQLTTGDDHTLQACPSARVNERPRVCGKFIHLNGHRFLIRGVTYGPFRADDTGCEYHDERAVNRDFQMMAANGINVVRTYTVPPRWLLDCAHRHGLHVMVGIAWEQHITFLDSRQARHRIERHVRESVQRCAAHPAVLCFTIGNEIPAPIVRWYGRRPIECFLRHLYTIAKKQDPHALITYVNYPTTEYLQLPFLDFYCFNVYLESPPRLAAYLARLQNIAGDRPLVMAEVGIDSRRHGVEEQASVMDWQIRTTFAAGCAGMCVFAWTDEWQRGGYSIDDWDFGLTDRERRSKPALDAVARAYADVPFPADTVWPRISVVVCTYNGAKTIRETCVALTRLDYPDYEVIVICDGSTDESLRILREFKFRIIAVDNGGLSCARNIGMKLADGPIIAYLDDDAYPDPSWLRYLAMTFMHSDHVGVGGPNIPPPDDHFVAQCVARSPGGPNHVLLSDQVAEHIPGCNMAFRKDALEAIGGFDVTFRIAGDDVDVCWRLQESVGTLGFSPAAVVWHHRRDTVRGYLKQQYNYGRAEAMLAAKWPRRYNSLGHTHWSGRLYGIGFSLPLFLRRRIYHGTWGTAAFQSMYDNRGALLYDLPLLPEWHLLTLVLATLSLVGLLWHPLLVAMPLLLLAVGISMVQAIYNSLTACLNGTTGGCWMRFKARSLIAWLHLVQPIKRLQGRLQQGLTPWRWPRHEHFRLPWSRRNTQWSETWVSAEARLTRIESRLLSAGAWTRRGSDFDPWDLEIRGGPLGGVRVTMTIEEHGAGRQLVRLRCRPFLTRPAVLLTAGAAALAGTILISGTVSAAITMGTMAMLLLTRALAESAVATSLYMEAQAKPIE